MTEKQAPEAHLSRLRRALESGKLLPVRRSLASLNPAEIATLLGSLPPRERKIVWRMVERDDEGEILLHVPESVREGLMSDMDTAELVAAAEELEIDDLADFIEHLPETVTQQVIKALDADDRARLESVLAYEPDLAGGLMNTDTVTVRPDVSLDVVQRYLRIRGDLPAHTDSLFVVDRYGNYLGALPLDKILTRAPDDLVSNVMERALEAFPDNTPAQDVAKRFEDADLVSAPVVSDKGALLGRITVDDVLDVIRAQAEHNLMSMAGLPEDEDIFAPIRGAARRRAIWLGINLVTAFMAAAVVGQFEPTIAQVTALAVLMPIIASMGGIGGSQTLTLMIRALALNQIGSGNVRFLVRKEIAVAAINGVVWALVVAISALLWFHSGLLALVVGMALLINQLAGALSGVVIPLAMKKMGIDPALAGSVVLTTVTDVMGFFTLLGLGTLILMHR
jgi:magnesium transporter